VTIEEGAAPPREQGWWGPILATLALLILPASPPFSLVVPFDQTLLLLAPALAVSAVVGWRAGGRLPLAIVWTVFAVWVLRVPEGASAFALLARGWAVLLAAIFGGVVLVGKEERFLPQALVAVLIALGLGLSVVMIAGGGVVETSAAIAEDVMRRAEFGQLAWQQFIMRPEWLEFARENPSADLLVAQVEAQFTELPKAARTLVPAMLALESLAALAIAWAVYHRFGRARIGAPLAPLRAFSFHEAFVWGIIAGLLVIVVPMPEVIRVIGLNLLVFFGALYVVRGLGVLLWFLSPGRWMRVLWTIVVVLFLQVTVAVALAIGIGDTWLDWRNRPRPKSQRSE
jgi:hypothetical protein